MDKHQIKFEQLSEDLPNIWHIYAQATDKGKLKRLEIKAGLQNYRVTIQPQDFRVTDLEVVWAGTQAFQAVEAFNTAFEKYRG